MSAVARPVEDDDGAEGILDALIAGTVKTIAEGERKNVVLGLEAKKIVDWASEQDPGAVCAYFHEHAVALVREQLQIRLADRRRRRRRGAFGGTEVAPNPWQSRYACEGNVWKRAGDMLRPDWGYVGRERTESAVASLAEADLARRVVAELPDDRIRTAEALSPDDFERLERAAWQRAERQVSSWERQGK